jgi:UDP:flavonoid glycosyltransferase YjiC (YdhE family)
MINSTPSNKPLVGFKPILDNLGDTLPLIEIAKRYMELGGTAVFFTYGKTLEPLVKELGCKIIKMGSDSTKRISKKSRELQYKYHYNKLPLEKVFQHLFNQHYKANINTIEKEVKAFKREKVKLIVTSFDLLAKISTYVAGIPLVFLTSGTVIPPYFESNLATFPDTYENMFTKYVPQTVKNRLANWYVLHCKWSVKGFNKLARYYKAPSINRFLDLFSGDYTLIADEIDFLNLKPTTLFPRENFVGPIIPDDIFKTHGKQIDVKIKKHLEKPGKSILLSLGSSGSKQMFLDILHALNNTKYIVIAIYGMILNENEIPHVNDNILLIKYVTSIKHINEQVDIAIIHGGRGTIYNAAYSGKPIIGIPMQLEQQCNLDNLVRQGMAIRLSKKHFNEEQLMEGIEEIFLNYNTYFNQALILKRRLPEPKGAENAAKRIIEIIQDEQRL